MKIPMRTRVLAAAGVVVVLAALLAQRLVSRIGIGSQKHASSAASAGASIPRETAPPSPATVPPPAPVDVKALSVPIWGAPGSEGWPVRFRTDLDLIAPLGNGRSNAAEWFKDFARPDGPRAAEAEAARKRMVRGPGTSGLSRVLPGDDPLLKEAEPWCDQATMRFYPDVFPVKGYATQLPNLLLMLDFAKAWVARGMSESESDPAAADADFERAVRLGRLLCQDDVTMIQDLFGIACIRYGTEGIYDLARYRGDTPRALAAAIVLGEHAALRFRTVEMMTRLFAPLSEVGRKSHPIEMSDHKLNDIIDVARSGFGRRFQDEAAIYLGIIRFYGTSSQRDRAREVLEEIQRSKDPILSAEARWSLSQRPTPPEVSDLLGR